MTDQVRERIRGLLVKAGDDRKKTLGNIRGLVAVLQEDMVDHRETIMISLIECGKYLPTKSGIYGCWLALMNPSNRVFVAETINGVYSELRYTVAEGKLEVSACLLRLLIECANSGCLSATSLVAVLRSVVEYSSKAGFKKGEFGLYLVASSVPWLSPAIVSREPEVSALMDELIAGISQLTGLAEYQARKAVIAPFELFKDRLEASLECVEKLRMSGWESEKVIIRPYLLEGIAEQLVNQLPSSEFVHSVPVDDISLFESIASQKYIPPVFFESVDDSYVLSELMSNTIDLLSQSVGECTKALLRIPSEDVFFEKILTYVVVSRAISSADKHPRVFYQSLLHRAIVLQESVKQQAEATMHAISELHALRQETQIAMADLICFIFCNNVRLDSLESFPEQILKRFLELAVRVTFVNTIKPKLPDSLHPLIPVELGAGEPFERPESDQAEFQKVKEVVRIKDGSEVEVIDLLTQNKSSYQHFVEALVENGSRTVTHFTRLIQLYGNILRRAVELELVSSEEEREAVLLWSVFCFWAKNSLRLEKCVELLLRENLVSVRAVVSRIEFDDAQLLPYKVADMLLSHLLRSRDLLKLELSEAEGTDRYDQTEARLALVESTLNAAVADILAKSNEGFQLWMVKKLSLRGLQAIANVDIAQLL